MIKIANKTHNNRDWTNHKKEVIRPSEKIAVEIFSYDHQYTKLYNRDDISQGFNFKKTNHRHLKCFESNDGYTTYAVELDYEVQEIGEYRIDVIYENKDGKDYVGRYSLELNQKSAKYINTKPVQYKTVTSTKKTGKTNTKVKNKVAQVSTAHRIKGNDLKFDGETDFIKRQVIFEELKELGKYHLTVEIPYNCYFIGITVRKIITFTGDNLDSMGTNLQFNECEFTHSKQTNPIEANFKIGYTWQLENSLSASGFYIDYMDEVNIYVKETGFVDDNSWVQRFGGYVSSISSDKENKELTINCADRLIDAQNKYMLNALFISGTTSQDLDYYKPLIVASYGEALKYLSDVFEITLNTTINKNFLVEGEKYNTGLSIKFGKKKDIKKLTTKNAITEPNNNYIMVRNESSATKQQAITLYTAKDHSKKPINISNYLTFHMMYGLGDPKKEDKKTDIVSSDSDSGTDGSLHFNKCGVSSDGKYVMGVGLPSAGGESSKYGYTWYKAVYERKCPFCGSTNVVYDVLFGNSAGAGRSECNNNKYESGGGVEGHFFCKSCDGDWSVFGKPHGGKTTHMHRVSDLVKSSKAEAQKLKAGNMTANPKTLKAVSSDDVLKSVAQKLKKYSYKLGAGVSTYSAMKKAGHGDCWAFSDAIFTELKKLKVSCRICQYATSESNNHRSVVYKNANNQWVNFPYKKYGFSRMLYPTSKCNPNKYVKNYVGKNISGASGTASEGSSTSTVTTTTGYDREKPPQFFIEVTYSTTQSWTAQKKKINLDFTLKGGTDSDWSGLTNFWINNAMRQTSVNMKGFFDDNEPNKSIYLHQIRLVANKLKTETEQDKAEWYTFNDSTQDFSSCKMDLYQIIFDDALAINPTDLQSCGKSVLSLIEDVATASGYRTHVEYGKHRKDDVVHFSINNQTKPVFVATEGDNNNILEWSNITYNPVANLRNKSICVFKKADGKYAYVDTADMNSLLKYGEKTTLSTESEQTSAKQAYFMARNSTEYNPDHEYSYTIIVPFAPHLKLGDLVQVISNNRKLNDVKTIESIKVKYSNNQIPHIHTELGLNELEPLLRIKKEQEELRNLTREQATVFSATATPITDEDIYIWDN
ncbi:MAG: hypothetical protein IJF83_11010 [Methanobrevibacter sp.]|nr:hypothetical protein [Methanobrevibacter sp.]